MLVPMVLLLLAAAAIGVGLGVGRLEVGGPLGIQVAGQTPSPAAEVVRVRIVGGQDFDPGGDDGKENGEQVPLAFDGNLGTAWGTEHYETAAFGGLKDGVGLWLRFGRSVRVGRITIVSPIPGWTFDLRAGGSPSDASDPLTSTDGRRSFQVGPSGKVTIELEPTETPGILVWMTSLAPDEGRFAAKIGEVRVGGTNQ
jgi:hypothetical protein